MKWLQKKFALSQRGAIDIITGSLLCALQNIMIILPVGLIYSFVMFMTLLYVSGFSIRNQSAVFYLSTSFVCVFLILFASWFQYNSTHRSAYRESEVRRLTLAESLTKMPLSFFADKNTADITASILNNCALLERNQSNFLVPLTGSMISTTIIALSLFIIDWRMALSALWVLPVSFVAAGLSWKAAKRVHSELRTSVFAALSHLVLKLGSASVALTGAFLYANDLLAANVFVLFLLITSRLYEPLDVSLRDLTEIIAARSSAEQMNYLTGK